jgi:hypothetical protein
MNRPSTAKEALIAEALGDMAALIARVETLAPELQASRQALVLSHKELVNEVAIFKTQMTQVIGFAKVQTAKHIGQSADEAAKKLIAIQTESMKSAGRELFRAEIDPPGPASEVAGEAVARGRVPHHSHGGHLSH